VNETREQRLTEHLLKIVLWEAKLVETDECWKGDLPQFTQKLYDEWMGLQKERNELLRENEDYLKQVGGIYHE